MKIWGYWATLGWALLAFFVGQFVGLVATAFLLNLDLSGLTAIANDGTVVTFLVAIANPLMIAVLVIAIWIARARPTDYLALTWPASRYIGIGLIGLAALIIISDALLYFSGYPVVTPFQAQSYTTAVAEGSLAGLWVGTVVLAPAGEEALYRGFLFRGWARSDRMAWPAIIVISLLWAAPHLQYDWTGILLIFVVGLFLGWMRWRSGSTLLTFALHALFNLESTLETVVQLYLLK
jgi:membrane protease YdiL (CAAX protease family)